MNICVLTVASNMSYGFDGTSEEEFELFHSNIDKILTKTGFGFDEEVLPNTDCSAYLWSDCDDFSYHPGIGGIEFEAKEEGDEITDLSQWFWDNVCCVYDLFKEKTDKEISEIANLLETERCKSEVAA